ncbi:MAG: V-type ATP synthase subunit E [Oscillospiraceae bacterium]|nr:V-type ATP synthase subunit E [Oscillospiraceae bacterium]
MSGLDRILSEISSRGRESAEDVKAQAQIRAEEIRADGRKKAQQTYDGLMERSRADIAREYASGCAGAEAAAKRRFLACRVECVDSAVNAVCERLSSLGAEEYFALIKKMFEKHLRAGSCIIAFGKHDLERLPKDFDKTLSDIASAKGAKVEISEKAADIDSGFILSFGDISENCSFSDVLESERDAVRDAAAAVLFA